MHSSKEEDLIKQINSKISNVNICCLEDINDLIDQYLEDSSIKGLTPENQDYKAAEKLIEWIKKGDYVDENGELKILPQEYSYSCLPLCLLDAIYSIGAHYTSTRNAVDRYWEKEGAGEKQYSDELLVNEPQNLTFLKETIGSDGESQSKFASEIVENRQLTSPVNGILKAKAVYECAHMLTKKKIETIKDFREAMHSEDVERFKEIEKDFRSVPGQTSGISFEYLKMLCGDSNSIKPDRHIKRFLSLFSSDPTSEISNNKAQERMNNIEEIVQKVFRDISKREIDYIVWSQLSKCKSAFL